MNDEEKKILIDIALSQYVGSRCELCGREYKNLEILKDSHPICLGWVDGKITFGCKICFETLKGEELLKERAVALKVGGVGE